MRTYAPRWSGVVRYRHLRSFKGKVNRELTHQCLTGDPVNNPPVTVLAIRHDRYIVIFSTGPSVHPADQVLFVPDLKPRALVVPAFNRVVGDELLNGLSEAALILKACSTNRTIVLQSLCGHDVAQPPKIEKIVEHGVE